MQQRLKQRPDLSALRRATPPVARAARGRQGRNGWRGRRRQGRRRQGRRRRRRGRRRWVARVASARSPTATSMKHACARRRRGWRLSGGARTARASWRTWTGTGWHLGLRLMEEATGSSPDDWATAPEHTTHRRRARRSASSVLSRAKVPARGDAILYRTKRRPSVSYGTASRCSRGPREPCACGSALSSAPISRALGTPAVERLREDTVLDGSTCARQDPVISEGPSRWRCGGGLSRRAVSRVLVTSAPTITHACDSTRSARHFRDAPC